MANTLKKAAGTSRLQALATGGTPPEERTEQPEQPEAQRPLKKAKAKGETVLIGAHFRPAARQSLFLLQADPRNKGKKVNDLLAEALNDLFAKYDVPQTAQIDREQG